MTLVAINPDFAPTSGYHHLSPEPVKMIFEKHCNTDYYGGPKLKLFYSEATHDICYQRTGAPLVRALFEAYARHGTICLSPDDIWQHCLGELSTWVNAHPEACRAAFTDATEKQDLTVEVPSLPRNAVEWQELIARFAQTLVRAAKPTVAAVLNTSFTTTTPLDRAVNSVLVLSSAKKFYDARIKFSCGFRYLDLAGTPEDWALLERAVGDLRPFGLARWVDEKLQPIVHQFVRARNGDVDVAWWNKIFREDAQRVGAKKLGYGSGYGEGYKYVTGWALGLCPQWLDVVPAESKVRLRDFPHTLQTMPIALPAGPGLQIIGGQVGFTETPRGFELVKGVAVLSRPPAKTASA